MMSKRFDRLSEKIAREYEKKGYSHATAEKYGRATAGKVAQEKEEKPPSSEGKPEEKPEEKPPSSEGKPEEREVESDGQGK